MPEIPIAPLSTYAPSALQVRETELVQQTAAQAGKIDLEKLDKAATEFEAILLGQWLNQAEHSFSSVPGSDEEHDDPGYSQWQSLGMQELAKSVAEAGGLGIARMIRQHYSRTAAGEGGPEGAAGAGTAAPDANQTGLNNGKDK